MTASTPHCLLGLEPDNLLAFLALLGLLRALEKADDALKPRISWDLDQTPTRPTLHLSRSMTQDEIAGIAEEGLLSIASTHDFGGRNGADYSREECREVLTREAKAARQDSRLSVDLHAAVMTDAVLRAGKDQVSPTPLCLMFGQGHQHFLQRLECVPRGSASKKDESTGSVTLSEALFHPWQRKDKTFSFRWDPAEDVRYALMAGNPKNPRYKPGTQHGANRLAAIGVGVLSVSPGLGDDRRSRCLIPGGDFSDHQFSFAWPIWTAPATLTAILAMLSHPRLREPRALERFGVRHVMVARRISVGKYMNVSQARPQLSESGSVSP
jgi:hypothetical protein